MPRHLNRFSDIAHIEDAYDPREMNEIVFPSARTENYLKRWVSRSTATRNVLLYGVPGTGKTRAAHILAQQRTKGTEEWNPISYRECESGTADKLVQELKDTIFLFQMNTHENFEQVFILDEIDNLDSMQQKQLKKVLERRDITYVLLTNNLRSIDVGVRNRCFEISWHVPEFEVCKPRLERLAEQMAIPSVTEDLLRSAYTTSGWRQMVRNLDVCSMM